MNHQLLRKLGVFGYDDVEPVILAALVTEDPLLLIGRAGTGKTFLLNSLSEALGLEHRHYNASLIAFDDLVGFPWPEAEGTGMRYIETPATVWKAESVLVDEINRCKPEHQNRLFSLVQERRIQGMKLEHLRYRWAAMNPAGFDQDGETYSGCEPLDAALADRFAFLVQVADWSDLTDEDQLGIADPRGEGAISRDACGLGGFIAEARATFVRKLELPDPLVLGYACQVATSLGEANLRISPRRVRQFVRNILAVESVSQLPRERKFRLALEWSLPQRSGLTPPDQAVIYSAHRLAWEVVCSEGEERWLHEFHSENDLAKKLTILLKTCVCPDTGTLAVSQFLASEPVERQVAFAFSLYPALLVHKSPPVGEEGIQDLGRVAIPALHVEKDVKWRDSTRNPTYPVGGEWTITHPLYEPALEILKGLPRARRARAEQVFLYLLSIGKMTTDPRAYESTLNKCISICKRFHGTSTD
ncbi:MAG: MoxR family ATPase [Terrimicrobiaceae bacterium]